MDWNFKFFFRLFKFFEIIFGFIFENVCKFSNIKPNIIYWFKIPLVFYNFFQVENILKWLMYTPEIYNKINFGEFKVNLNEIIPRIFSTIANLLRYWKTQNPRPYIPYHSKSSFFLLSRKIDFCDALKDVLHLMNG